VGPTDCNLPHIFEYAASVDVGGEIDHYPSPQEWIALAVSHCTGPAEAQLGGAFDPDGKYRPDALTQTQQTWERGTRSIICGIGSALPAHDTPDGTYVPFTGAARFATQWYDRPAGSCAQGRFQRVVDCSQPHEFEHSGTFDLSARTPTPPAPDDRTGWQTVVGEGCTAPAVAHLGRALRSDEQVRWFQIDARSWALGRHSVTCAIVKIGNDEPLTIMGSMKGT
jgi:hypothetical protein